MTRDEALQALVGTRVSWPGSYEQAIQAPDGDPSYEPDFWWSEDEQTGEVYLSCEGRDNLTRQNWSDARRKAINRPETWPDGARILVQVPNDHHPTWIFGTFADARPDDGGWQGTGIGTWLNEGQAMSSANVAGWDWTCSLVHRDVEDEREAVDLVQPFDPLEGDLSASRIRYRFLRVHIDPDEAERGFFDLLLDVYRICDLYEVGGGPREHIIKEALLGPRLSKECCGDDDYLESVIEVISDIQVALDRWREMAFEDHARL